MSQSVKLSDGSYIDASAVWDSNLGMTQAQINMLVNHQPIITKVDSGDLYALVYNHNSANGNFFDSTSTGKDAGIDTGYGVSLSSISDCYSRMHKIADWSDYASTGEFTFIYEDVTNSFSNKWSQAINPVGTNVKDNIAYTAISMGKTSNFSSGLRYGDGNSSLWTCSNSGTWWFPIYQYVQFGTNQIPTAGINSYHVRLWVRAVQGYSSKKI